ncbi:hypothetical protein GQ44DRAFT_796789 [Phaeosphaeriaceae sp. PMI808]|nr:hypothetical protein GQ44DRAFT_796789 [Phaeosphaeriaceae sp. PMI808]
MWHHCNVYYRDFAYSTRRLRMANGSIGDAPAGTFAEYVDDPFLELPNGDDADASRSNSSHPQLPCLALRPGLAHRLYSHRLHVRAKAKLQRDRLLSGPMIDIYVGEGRRHWALHRNLLCHHSELLEAELEGDGKDTKRKDKLELPEHDPAGFELLVKWLYQGKLDHVSDIADTGQKYDYAVNCHKLYLLCDRLDIPQLKNVAMDQYRQGLNEAELVPDADEIDEIYRKSPSTSPFRQLMTRIAARQIMDPGSERGVETYRQCFDNNPNFAIDLVKAIKHGTGGMLFEDPTEPSNPCEYHDHKDGPNCHIKGKGKGKQARKTSVPRLDQPSTKSIPSTNSDQLSHPPLPYPPKVPHQPLLRQARPQDSTGTGPLRRRLTSPAISTVGTSPETAVATLPPNLDGSKDREKWRKVTPPEKKQPPEGTWMLSHPALEDRLLSLDGMSHPPKDSANETIKEEETEQQAVTRWKGPLTKTDLEAATNMAANSQKMNEPYDDFTIPDEVGQQRQPSTSKPDGLGIASAAITSPSFAQTKQSSDDLVGAASGTGTPESKVLRDGLSINGERSTPVASKGSPPSTPDTPTPRQRRKDSHIELSNTPIDSVEETPSPTPHKIRPHVDVMETNGGQKKETEGELEEASHNKNSSSEDTPRSNTSTTIKKPSKNASSPNPNRIPKYKIALASNLFPTARAGTTST